MVFTHALLVGLRAVLTTANPQKSSDLHKFNAQGSEHVGTPHAKRVILTLGSSSSCLVPLRECDANTNSTTGQQCFSTCWCQIVKSCM